jgi:hypothetical protein
MDEKRLHDHYLERGAGEEAARAAVAAVRDLERDLARCGRTLRTATEEDVSAHVARLVATGENTEARLLALARYFRLTGATSLYIVFTRLFGSDGVLSSIRERTAALEGEAAAEAVFRDVPDPPLGTPPAEMPEVARRLMEGFGRSLPPDRARAALCGNHHRIPVETFRKERERYLVAASLEDYLEDRHARMVEELARHAADGTVWFEQAITPRVVDFVRTHPEILSAVREGDALLATKIPYDPDGWLGATDLAERRHLACHCPFVREALRARERTGEGASAPIPPVPPDWCYCSAGFEKVLFDTVLGEDLEVEVLESALLGQDRCRFRIRLPEGIR